MKTLLLFPLIILTIFNFTIRKDVSVKTGTLISATILKNQNVADEIVGQWKKVAGGEDANKNRVLEDAEINKNPEPGAYDNLQFNNDGTCRLFGMGMQLEGMYLVKTVNNKKMILVYQKDTPADQPQDQKDKSASKFEIVSADANKLVLIPPIYTFMLVVYERAK